MLEEIKLKELFNKFFVPLCKFAFVITKDKMLAEDAVQQVFINLYRKNEMANVNSVESYLFISAKNNALNLLNQQNTRARYESNFVEMKLDEDTEKTNIEVFREKLTAAISSLPNQCRIVYQLKQMEGLTYKEIASYLEISEKTVENQMGIALKKLRVALMPYKNEVLNY